jgi:predicted O-methyltransferase YrrM
MNRQVETAISFFRHLLKSQSKYRLHSPFVYDFYKNVIQNKHEYSQYRVVNRLRKELESLSRFIKRKDLGAHCKDFPGDQRFVRVRDIAHHSSVNRKKGELIFKLVKWLNPTTILEFGTSLGISAMYMALAIPEGRVITMEGCIDSANIARENFEKTGQKNVRVITGDFGDILTETLSKIPNPDLVFFDGNHRKEPTIAYFEQCLQHINPSSVFIFDDIHWSAGMEEAWSIIQLDERVKVTIDLFHLGIVFFRDELSKENFVLRY